MSSYCKNMFRWFVRFAFKLALVACLICIVLISIIFFFPEKIVETAAPYVLSGLDCRTGSITWLANGLRLYDLHLAFRGSTADLERVSLTWQTEQYSPLAFRLTLNKGTLSLFVPDTDQTDTVASDKDKKQTHWWNTLQSPVSLSILATNIDFLVEVPRLDQSFAGNFSVAGHLSSTALLNRVSGSCSGLLPSPDAVAFSITQLSNLFDITCENYAVDLPRLTEIFARYFPDFVSCSSGQADASLHSRLILSADAPVLTNTRLTANLTNFDAVLPQFEMNARHASGNLFLYSTRAVDLHTNHPDLVRYLLESFRGSSDGTMRSFTCKNIPVTNISFQARILSNALHLVSSELYTFGGRVSSFGRLARKKVKNKSVWRFRYDLALSVTNLDAGTICDTFNLRENRLEGRFHGSLSTYIFNRWVKKFNGTLNSQGNGIFYFPESEKYVGNMDSGMQKQMVSIMTDRLKKYPYQICHIDLDYDHAKKLTGFTFGFYSDYDNSSYLFPIVIHMSWLDALKLLNQFQ